MTDFKKAFIDTAPFIYFIEKDSNNPQYYEKVKYFFKNGYEHNKKFVSSVITMEEYFVFPYRNEEYEWMSCYDKRALKNYLVHYPVQSEQDNEQDVL